MNILLTGGAGYVGSHTAVEILSQGHDVVILDNLSNSSEEVINRIALLSGRRPGFQLMDLLDKENLECLFEQEKFDAVIHFAGLKAVGESVALPLSYYRNNIEGTINLCESMLKHGVNQLVFSSSATVYGNPERIPIDENCQVIDATNPYGRTKLFIEKILEDVCNANPDFRVISLRYFNPVGAHESGTIGEDPNGVPNNLLPYISQVAVGKRDKLTIHGNDYPTPDGTGVRDYIHVCDLASGHLAALSKFSSSKPMQVFNLGTGKGTSVMEILQTFEQVNKVNVPYEIGPRREGDIAVSYTDPKLASSLLEWQATHSLEDICRDAWNWQSKNPNGYE